MSPEKRIMTIRLLTAAIPLAANVSVVPLWDKSRRYTVVGSNPHRPADFTVVANSPGHRASVGPHAYDKWRVNIGDDQGFGYALRFLASHEAAKKGPVYDLCCDLAVRHTFGFDITDADRDALDEAITAVVQRPQGPESLVGRQVSFQDDHGDWKTGNVQRVLLPKDPGKVEVLTGRPTLEETKTYVVRWWACVVEEQTP